jgi:hypothetical protein
VTLSEKIRSFVSRRVSGTDAPGDGGLVSGLDEILRGCSLQQPML